MAQINGKVTGVFFNEKNAVLVVEANGKSERFSTLHADSIRHVKKGATVSFPAKQNGKWWNINGDVEVTSAAPPASVQARNDDRQRVIMFQHSQNVASRLLPLALEQGAIKLPSKDADKLEALLAAHDMLSMENFDKVLGFMDEDEKADEAPEAKPTADGTTPTDTTEKGPFD